MKKEVFDLVKDDIFAITFNLNDTFYYACADSSTIDIEDLEDLEPVIEKYSRDAIIAYEAIKRGHDPQVPMSIDNKFKEAKQMILDLMATGDKYGPFYDLKWVQDIKPRTVEDRKKKSKLQAKFREYFSFWGDR